MGRSAKKSYILAKVETTVGTDALPTGAANSVLVSDLTINPVESSNIDRGIQWGYFGASEQLQGSIQKKLEFTVELQNGGTAGTAPAYDALLQACAFAGATGTTPSRYTYTPISASIKTLTIYAHDSGVLHKYLAALGDVEFSIPIGGKPIMKFSFTAIDGGDTAVSDPTPVYTNFKTPLAGTSSNTANPILGGTIAAGVVTGGTNYPSTGLQSLKMGNVLSFTELTSIDAVDITDRKATGSIELDLTAAQEVALLASIKTNASQSLSITHGTTAGYMVRLWLPAAQLYAPKKIEKNGRRLIGFDFTALPSAGNDEVQLILL